MRVRVFSSASRIIVSFILERGVDFLWLGSVGVNFFVVILISSGTLIVGIGCWEVIKIDVKDWRREKSVMLSFWVVRALGVDPEDDKEIKVRLRNRKLDELIYVLRWYFWSIVSAVVG